MFTPERTITNILQELLRHVSFSESVPSDLRLISLWKSHFKCIKIIFFNLREKINVLHTTEYLRCSWSIHQLLNTSNLHTVQYLGNYIPWLREYIFLILRVPNRWFFFVIIDSPLDSIHYRRVVYSLITQAERFFTNEAQVISPF
jgi:hypothetical protein